MPRPTPGSSASPIPALVGPTAVGKTAAGLMVARRLDAEIVSADSRQVYRELNIGTAKPSADELKRVPHHFINELGLGARFSAGTFASHANERIAEIVRRGRTPVIVGGSTLYLQALLHGLATVPEADESTRLAVESRLKREGSLALHRELQALDPDSAKKLDPTKTHRLVRALEVFYQTGRTLSSFLENHMPPPFHFKVSVLTMDRSRLYERINRRVDQMLADGLLQEVREIKAMGFDTTLPALKTIGYQECFAHLAGSISMDEMIRLIKRNTRRYAKRQLTWFRRYDQGCWLDVDSLDVSQLAPALQLGEQKNSACS